LQKSLKLTVKILKLEKIFEIYYEFYVKHLAWWSWIHLVCAIPIPHDPGSTWHAPSPFPMILDPPGVRHPPFVCWFLWFSTDLRISSYTQRQPNFRDSYEEYDYDTSNKTSHQ
jgi:hypothetical protein